MKNFKLVMLSGVVIGGLLAGCGNLDAETSGNSEPQEEPKEADQKDVSNKEETQQESSSGKKTLEEAGETLKDENGKLELLKINKVNEVVKMDSVNVTFEDIKIFKRSEMPEDLATYLNDTYDRSIDPKEGFVYLQLTGEIENTEDKNVNYNGIETIVTDKGQQIDAYGSDFIFDSNELGGELMGKVKGPFYGGYILNDKDISSIKVIIGNVLDNDSYESLADPQEVEFKIE